jgi:hypothetical protein
MAGNSAAGWLVRQATLYVARWARNNESRGMTFHADRSWTGGLALCRGAGGVCLCHEHRSQSVVVQTPRHRGHTGGGFVRSDIRILDLLPARLAASDVDSGPEVSGHRGRAGRPRYPAKAEQSGHGHLAAPEHFAVGIHPTSY